MIREAGTPLFIRRRKFDMTMVYKILHGLTGLHSNSLFNVRASITRGSEYKLSLPRVRKDIRKFFFVNRAGTEYEKLSKRHEIPQRLSTFKTFLEMYLKS